MDYQQALGYLTSFADFERSGRFVARPDLAPTQDLLEALGKPQTGPLSVHIAGSKGKGSTAAMLASILREAGLRTGLYTSPHLHTFCERIRVDGEPISREAFVRHVEALVPAVEEVRARHPERQLVTFDLLTALAFRAFREEGVDVQVIETGLGGRLDPSNVLEEKAVCIITPISLEHTAILGDTLAKIAREKAGIITPAAVVVMSLQRESAAAVIRQTCAERGASLVEVAQACAMTRTGYSSEGQDFRLRTPGGTYGLHLPLLGRHQLENAATAVLAAEALAQQGMELSAVAFRRGLEGVRWPGRLEIVKRRPLVVVDGAHNGESARRLRETLEEDLGIGGAILVVGYSGDKEATALAREMGPVAARVIATRSRSPRAAPPQEVAAAFAEQGIAASCEESVAAAMDAALAQAEPGDAVCVFGSLFVAAEAREHLLGIAPDLLPAGQGP
ncbi:MAG: folylpolyglutamate synthase/dihydrofolate synthase family protein [Dehalococcoidia bacterium]